jgi:hypothetical protein
MTAQTFHLNHSRIKYLSFNKLYHFNHQTHDTSRCKELSCTWTFCNGKLTNVIFINTPRISLSGFSFCESFGLSWLIHPLVLWQLTFLQKDRQNPFRSGRNSVLSRTSKASSIYFMLSCSAFFFQVFPGSFLWDNIYVLEGTRRHLLIHSDFVLVLGIITRGFCLALNPATRPYVSYRSDMCFKRLKGSI